MVSTQHCKNEPSNLTCLTSIPVIDSPNFQQFFDTDKTSPIIGAINSTFSGGAVFGSLMVRLEAQAYRSNAIDISFPP